MPPATMPTMAEATASVAAPGTPACSKSGANASPVAGPPMRVSEPAITPRRGGAPSARARPTPTRFCTAPTAVAIARSRATAGPPRRSNGRLAPKPMAVKKATMSGD